MLNLILFHRLLIATAIIFCATFAAWEFGQFTRSGGASRLILAIVFALLAVALSWYLKRLARVLNLPGNRKGQA
jgi:hypothetical protein